MTFYLKNNALLQPISITPAFSPGPCITYLALWGNFFNQYLEDLYEQCSLHIAEKSASSVLSGSLLKRTLHSL